ncbi:MAG: DUF3293 domain-containing protein [Steroidobacteraceae bacterium]
MQFREVDRIWFSDRALAARRDHHDSLLQAYRATRYEVEAPSGFVLEVGRPSAELLELHILNGVDSSAFVTAWNPLSLPASDTANASAHASLIHEAARRGWSTRDAWGRGPSSAWPAERSLLILGVSPTEAVALGERFQQAAILSAAADATPRLYVLDLPVIRGMPDTPS